MSTWTDIKNEIDQADTEKLKQAMTYIYYYFEGAEEYNAEISSTRLSRILRLSLEMEVEHND